MEKVDFTSVKWGSVEWTSLCTLYLRAYDARAKDPVLGDEAAAEAVQRIDYDFGRIGKTVRPSSNRHMVALRARQLDLWTAQFLARHVDAVVLHLGCGLDSRVFRIDPPSAVDWFDLDLPELIELRRRVYPERERCHLIGASVTDSKWLEAIPRGRPTLVVAEGLLMFLPPDEVRRLLARITDDFSRGELLFDGLAPWMARILKTFRWGTRDGEIEQWNPRMRCIEVVPVTSTHRLVPDAAFRNLLRVMNAFGFTRRIIRLFRYAF